ncbi:sugar ABC transporter substrate-binding protein [Metabacillus endolithicus]|uniref:Sugar ABC transporter substrate-binding protein n=1 Tax=Metabacillus endolithicus TaxID=1535204 RepID=A0ABW5C170_9BACI|nr:sugar ABC transporter substrate-binding protein [Metabacillus endolithicus]UPG62598.1 sugar ABC transporter substrate-binding protein [Metabacillus endolithicus]
MRKNIFLFVLTFVSVLLMAACGNSNEQTSVQTEDNESNSDNEYYIGWSVLSTESDFLSQMTEKLQNSFKERGIKFDVASADFNPTKQIEQIENFISLGVDEIIVMAVDPSSLTDVLQKAHDQGVKVVAFSQKTSVYDKFFGANEIETGKAQAEMAADWVESTFPDAEPGSVEVAIFEYRDKPIAAERSDGLAKITEFSDKVKVVETVGVDSTTEGGQAAAENLFLTKPNVKAILSYNSDTAMGVNAYVSSINSRVEDKSQFATFGVDFNPSVADAIAKSANNESVMRGTIVLGGSLDETVKVMVDGGLEVLEGNVEVVDDYAELTKVTLDNLDQVQ